MDYQPISPIINLSPEIQQSVDRPVQAHGYHSWRIVNDSATQLLIRVECALVDNLGHRADSFDRIGRYGTGEYSECTELAFTVAPGYGSPQVVLWKADTRLTVVLSDGSPDPNHLPRQSSKSKSIQIVPNEAVLKLEEDSHEGVQDRLFDPVTSSYDPVIDATEEIREISERYPPSKGETEGFLEHRRRLLEEASLGECNTVGQPGFLPPPGGVGLGVMLKPHALNFVSSTAIRFYVVAPKFLLGKSAKLLYLTSSNRARCGCEALVSYECGRPAVFRIWDWSLPEDNDGNRWAPANIGYAKWDPYKLTLNLNGTEREALYVVNSTRELSHGSWVNEVYLRKVTGELANVWRREFPWTPIAPGEKYLGWGPLIEHFASDYGDTNDVGFADARMVQDGVDYLLSPLNSNIKWRCVGFQITHLDQNYNLIAH